MADVGKREGSPGSPGQKLKWKVKSLRSGFGTQTMSQKASAAAAGFGSADREGSSRLYVSPEADRAKVKAEGGHDSPGPIYRVQETLGRQVLSTMESDGVVTFGTSKREGMAIKSSAPGPGHYPQQDTDANRHKAGTVKFATASRDAAEKVFISAEHDKSSGGRDSPGPSMYSYDASGAVLSDRHRDPAWSMGLGGRSDPTGSKQSASMPGVGTYDTPSGLGRQVTRRSLPVTAFGRAGRDASSKLYLSPEHDKASSGSSPGPTTAAHLPAFRRQQLSNKINAPAVGFARSARQTYSVRPGPGPGEYDA